MNSFISYLKNPDYCERRKLSAIKFIALYFFYYLAALAIGLIIAILCKVLHLEHLKIEAPPVMTILFAVLLAPFCEEVIFRSLLRFKWSSILLFIPTAMALSAYSLNQSKFLVPILLSIFVIGLLLMVTIFTRKKVELFIASKFKYFFYSSSILFGLGHGWFPKRLLDFNSLLRDYLPVCQ